MLLDCACGGGQMVALLAAQAQNPLSKELCHFLAHLVRSPAQLEHLDLGTDARSMHC